MGATSIEWTDASWNPVVGCSRVSPGCQHCYAERLAGTMLKESPAYKGLTRLRLGDFPEGHPAHEDGSPRWTGQVRLLPDRLDEPIRWRKPRRIFVCDMGDLFHEDVPDEYIDRVFAVMAAARWHTFQVLTKRADRMMAYCASDATLGRFTRLIAELSNCELQVTTTAVTAGPGFHLPNVWLGVSVEDQRRADERIPVLLQTPAAVRFVSAEPLLETMDLGLDRCSYYCDHDEDGGGHRRERTIDWVIVGGESGPSARPCNMEWIRRLRDQCREPGVACFVKQLGRYPVIRAAPSDLHGPAFLKAENAIGREWPLGTHFGNPTGHDVLNGRVVLLRDPKGGDPSEWPEDLKVREFPA